MKMKTAEVLQLKTQPTGEDGRNTEVKDQSTVTSEGKRLGKVIEGVKVHPLVTHPDDRGTLTELYNEKWELDQESLNYSTLVSIRPGQIKGWVKHLKQADRIAAIFGTQLWVLYDDRKDSPTYGMVNELCFSEHNRSIFTVPIGVYHAVKNVGIPDAIFVNLPTRAYDHTDPDKYRIPLDNDVIPYEWR